MQKQKVEQLLAKFPDDVDLDAFLERLILLEKIEEGERELANGKGIDHEDVKHRLAQWLE
jgi:hypothetical protein